MHYNQEQARASPHCYCVDSLMFHFLTCIELTISASAAKDPARLLGLASLLLLLILLGLVLSAASETAAKVLGPGVDPSLLRRRLSFAPDPGAAGDFGSSGAVGGSTMEVRGGVGEDPTALLA